MRAGSAIEQSERGFCSSFRMSSWIRSRVSERDLGDKESTATHLVAASVSRIPAALDEVGQPRDLLVRLPVLRVARLEFRSAGDEESGFLGGQRREDEGKGTVRLALDAAEVAVRLPDLQGHCQPGARCSEQAIWTNVFLALFPTEPRPEAARAPLNARRAVTHEALVWRTGHLELARVRKREK